MERLPCRTFVNANLRKRRVKKADERLYQLEMHHLLEDTKYPNISSFPRITIYETQELTKLLSWCDNNYYDDSYFTCGPNSIIPVFWFTNMDQILIFKLACL